MPSIKGIEIAKLLNGFSPLIIFTTAYAQYALEGYRVNAIDYLVKPIFPDDFHRSIQKAKNYFGLIEVNALSPITQELIIKSQCSQHWRHTKTKLSTLHKLRSLPNCLLAIVVFIRRLLNNTCPSLLE